MPSPSATSRITLADALAMDVERDGEGAAVVHTAVHDGFDVFGIPHGGYLAALAANAILRTAEQPDVFTITAHYLTKASVGPMDLRVRRLGGSRRFASWQATATQGGREVLTAIASVGDRTGVDGPSWSDAQAWDTATDRLTPPAGDPSLPFTPPRVAEQFGLRLAVPTTAFAASRTDDRAWMRGTLAADDVDQLTAIVACDLTPPAAWNVLGAHGWVPTVELTAHIRARPAAAPLSIDVATHHVHGGFLEEDAVVRDATGTLVAQSRQLARWTAA